MKMNGLKLFVLSIGIMTSFSSYDAFGQNKYPILQEIINNTENLFHEGYTFEDCKDIVEKLQLDIKRFERNGTADEADNMKEEFLKVKDTIVSALGKLEDSVNDESMKREIHEYIWNVLNEDVLSDIWLAYDEALKRK